MSAAEQSRLLRVAAVVREHLAGSGRRVALISRSGQDLARYGHRYSHMGVSLAASANTPWSVRQLYFACDEGASRLFDEGLAGFVMGLDNPRRGHLSLLLLPAPVAVPLEARALDNSYALALLGSAYSANAHPFDTRYQNCNQWVVELLAAAWGGLPAGADLRRRAQDWLLQEGYQPARVAIASPWWLLAAAFVPWVHTDDHPPADLQALQVRLSLPEAIEAFVRRRVPGAERIELCHDERQVVVRRGWQPLAADCAALPGDEVVALDD